MLGANSLASHFKELDWFRLGECTVGPRRKLLSKLTLLSDPSVWLPVLQSDVWKRVLQNLCQSLCQSKALKSLLAAIVLMPSTLAMAMPQLFLNLDTGNERDVSWKRIETKRFSVYHDARSLPMARVALQSVEFAYPQLSYLLGVKLKGDSGNQGVESRFERIPMVLSTQADGAAFANLATQSIELPLAFGAQTALYQHELVHRLMYEHFDPSIGVLGRIVSLAMVPTWWMEGLPEMLTESMGRLETEGIMRTMAREKSYLSFDRLHALYKSSGDVFLRGYITSGRFLSYLWNQMGKPDLAQVHKDLGNQTVFPPFVNAANQYLDKKLEKSPGELYEEFKKSEQQRVQEEYRYMPSLLEARTAGPSQDTDPRGSQGWVVSSGTPHVVLDPGGQEVFVSQLSLLPYPSGFLVNRGFQVTQSENERKIEEKETDPSKIGGERLPINLEGSRVWDLNPLFTQDGEFWTVRGQTFGNGTVGHQIRFVKFKGKFSEISDSRIESMSEIPFATESRPHRITKIWSTDRNHAFVLTRLRGASELFFVDAQNSTKQSLRKWESPAEIRLVESTRVESEDKSDACVTLIVNRDLEKTSLEKICRTGASEVLIPPEVQYIRAGVQLADASYVLLVGWGKTQGLMRWTSTEQTFLGGFPDWVENLTAWDGKSIGAWIFDGYDYTLHSVSPQLWKARFSKWDRGSGPWTQDPKYIAYQPPFVELAKTKQEDERRTKSGAESGRMPDSGMAESSAAKPKNATYRHSHWYSYPLLIPPPLDSWSLGLLSVPWNEEMERQRLQIYATYNFFTKSLSGTATYLNQRIFDGFSLDAYSRERFNGLYYLDGCDKEKCQVKSEETKGSYKRLSTLREIGFGLNTLHKFQPTSLVLNLRADIFRTNPLFGSGADVLGAQRATIGTVGGTLSSKVFESAFYTKGRQPGGRFVLWSGTLGGSADTYRSLGVTQTGRGENAGAVEFQKYTLGASTGVTYRDHAVTLRASGGTTKGASPLNWKEVFQPYRTYLSGTGAGLNNINLPVAGDNSLFSLRQGVGSFRTSLDYSLDLISDIDTQFYILYFENLRAEFVVGRGGVTSDKELKSGYRVVDSASVATRLLIDIKGVQVYPSLAAGKILGAPGWALFTELAFAQLF